MGPFLVFAAFPLGFAAVSIGMLDLQAVDAAILIVTLLVALRRLTDGKAPLGWARPLGWWLALVVWGVISFTSAADQGESIQQLGSLLTALVLACVVIAACQDLADVRRLLTWFAIVAVGIIIPALLNAGQLRAYYGASLVEGRLQGLFIEPNELGAFCSMGALVTAGLALGATTAWTRLFYGAAAGFLLTGLTMSLSRGAWIGTVAGMAFLFLSLRDARRVLLTLSIPVLIVATLLGAFGSASPQVEVVGERVRALIDTDQPYESRPEIWAEARRQIQEDPLTGEGPGNFGIASRRVASASLTVYAPHAHNLYLNFGAELGLPGLTFFVAFIVALSVAGKKAFQTTSSGRHRSDRALLAGLSAALVAAAVHAVFNVFLGNPIMDATTWSLVGVFLVVTRQLGTTENAAEGTGYR